MQNNDSDVLDALNRIEQRLISVERWLKFSNMDKLKGILSNELNDDRKKMVYECSDGSRGYRDVGKMAGIPGTTIRGWWDRWFSIGIMEPSPNRAGRVQRICSLHDVGIDTPIITKGKTTKIQADEKSNSLN